MTAPGPSPVERSSSGTREARRRPSHTAWPRRLVAGTSVFAMAVGALTLAGWAFDLPRLTDLRGDGISMFPNPAACALASGLALLMRGLTDRRWRAVAEWLGAAVALVAGLTLVEHLTGIGFGIDTLLVARQWGQAAAAAPMRMGLPASTALLLIGTALVLLDRGVRARGVAAMSGLAVMAISMLSLIGYLYGAQQMYTIPWLTGIARQAAVTLLALGLGVVASVPDREPMRTALEPGAAGLLVRRALPIVVACALLLGGGSVLLQERGVVDRALGTALRTVIEIVFLAVLLWWAAARVRTQERALRASEIEGRRQAHELEMLADTAAIAMHRIAPDGTILWANDAELQMLGYTREEYVGRLIVDFHADPGAIADILGRLARGERLREHPARLRCKDGTLKSVLIDSSALWDEGRLIHVQCFTRDVTEREQAEEVRALLAAIVTATDDAVVSKTLDGIVTSWNAGAERIFGYAADEMVGKPIALIIPRDRLQEEQEILARLRRGESIDHFDTVRVTKDGRRLDVSLTISPVRDDSGRIIGASKIARDVTDRKREETERAEGERRKDEFIAILGHELRNPLAPVRNAARYLKLRGWTDPDIQRPVDMIERQVAQMSRLIDDLLDLSRISRGTLELRREHVTSAEIVDAAVEACRDDIQAKAHRLRLHMPAAPIELHADRERLVQVLCNLIGNAAKYTPAGGDIEITVAVPANGAFTVSVKDNGLGIPRAKLTEIFDLFARVEHSLERQGGLGIGLTLVRQLVELHGGTIEARSEGVGHGSEFLLKLPVRVPAASPAVAAPVPASAPLRIVVADDSPDAVESLVLLLELAGHQVHGAADGAAAIDAIQRLRPDVALLDIGMPKANGYEVARRIREHPWGDGIFLVALTGWGQQSDKDRTRDAGFDAHLVKPVPLDALERLLAGVGAARSA